MNGPGMAIFIIFFGLVTLEAIRSGHWIRATFWIVVCVAFWMFDRARRRPVGIAEPGQTDR